MADTVWECFFRTLLSNRSCGLCGWSKQKNYLFSYIYLWWMRGSLNCRILLWLLFYYICIYTFRWFSSLFSIFFSFLFFGIFIWLSKWIYIWSDLNHLLVSSVKVWGLNAQHILYCFIFAWNRNGLWPTEAKVYNGYKKSWVVI